MQLIGRQRELKILRRLRENNKASLVVMYGRRRIGKSRLLKEFGKDDVFYSFSGFPPTEITTAQDQRNEFMAQLSEHTNIPNLIVDDWSKIFLLLFEKAAKGKVTILLDEISWMGDKDPTFLGKLKNAWDLYFSQNPKLILALCGSISSWIEKNILSSTGFLGRVSLRINLKELSIFESLEFFQKYTLSAHEKLKFLSITGGVPRYLEEMDPRYNAEENIKRLCFSANGVLLNEFDEIFSDLFASKNILYQRIIEFLTDGAKHRGDIAKHVALPENGVLTDYLNDLEKAGFIGKYHRWNIGDGKISNLSVYRICDNYTRFYLKYVKPQYHLISSGLFEAEPLETLPNWNAIMGLQFESMIINNAKIIIERLGINPTSIRNAGPYFENKTKAKKGVQVDYMIQTSLNELYICEVKYSKKPIGIDIIDEMKDKISRISIPKNFSIRPVLICASGVSEELEDVRYFVQILDFAAILS